MGATYGGIPARDPVAVWEQCRVQQAPTDLWFGKANVWRCPLGMEPGRAWLLAARSDLNSLDLNKPHPLVWSDGVRSVTIAAMLTVKATCITPGARGDPDAPYLLELADRRLLLAKRPIDRAYNLQGALGGPYLSPTLNNGSLWTWAQMVGDIWAAAFPIDPYPGLPYTPDGSPSGFAFFGGNAWNALGDVLARLTCALRYDPFADAFSIVQLGAPDPAEAAAELRWDGRRLWDDDYLESSLAKLPQYVRVVFQKQPPPSDGTSTVYTIDVADVSPDPNASAGTWVVVQDDEPAMVVGASVTNAAALASRAAERAADWFQAAKESRMHRVYIGVVPEPAFVPGSQVAELAVEDRGRGVKTEVVRPTALPDWRRPSTPGAAATWPPPPPGYGLVVENVNTPNNAVNPCTVLLADNDQPDAKAFGRIHVGAAGGSQALLDWQGARLYLAGFGYTGGEPDTEVVPGPNITLAIAEDAANRRNKVQISSALAGVTGGLLVENADFTGQTYPCNVLIAENTNPFESAYDDVSKFGRIIATYLGGNTARIDWQGLKVYQAGAGYIGPEPNLQFLATGGATIPSVVNNAALGTVDVTINAGAPLTVRNVNAPLNTVNPCSTLKADNDLSGVNDVQTISITGTPAGGAFNLLPGATAAAVTVAWNETAAALQTALQADANIGAGGVTVTGGPLPGTPLVVTFTGAMGSKPQPPFGLANSLTPSGTPVVTHTTMGLSVTHARLFETASGSTSTWDFQGLIAYLAGVGSVGPAIDLELANGCQQAWGLSFDPWYTSPTGRDALKITSNTVGYTGSRAFVTTLSFDSSACALTYSTATITVNCGAVTNIG